MRDRHVRVPEGREAGAAHQYIYVIVRTANRLSRIPRLRSNASTSGGWDAAVTRERPIQIRPPIAEHEPARPRTPQLLEIEAGTDDALAFLVGLGYQSAGRIGN